MLCNLSYPYLVHNDNPEYSPSILRRLNPEVLAPAGNLDTLKTAIDFGADAVYCGGKAFGMRAAPRNFSLEDFEDATTYAHQRGARVYVTCNILPDSDEVVAMNEYMGQLGEIGVDALIVTDIGVLMAARRVAPDTDIHISTQAGVTNYQAAEALAALGANRVVLARELDLPAIRMLRAHVSPELEIEAFVHGSMCMAFSGRCLISQHTTGRDANHGDCVQACRYKYHVVEEKKSGNIIPVEVTDQGSFLFNSQDMNMVEHVADVIDAGVTSLKIEGRAKSAYYVAAMANAYKCAVNEYMVQRGFENAQGQELKPLIPSEEPGDKIVLPDWIGQEPYKVTHREYSTGFYYPENPASESITKGGYINAWRWLGSVRDYRADEGRVYILAKNKITPLMPIEFLIPGARPIEYQIPDHDLWDEFGHEVPEINHPAHEFSFPCPLPLPTGAMIRAKVR